MLTDPFQSDHDLRKRKARFIEDVQTDFAIAKIRVRIVEANPIDKSIKVAGEYTDYLLARKLGAAKKWEVERVV